MFDALREGRFHVFPDKMAKEFEAAYEGDATNVIEAEVAENA